MRAIIDEKAVALQAGVWLWDIYGKSILDKAIGLVKTQWEKFNWKQAAENYRQKIRTRYCTMHIFGMAEPVSLEGIYTNVFTLDKIANHDRANRAEVFVPFGFFLGNVTQGSFGKKRISNLF